MAVLTKEKPCFYVQCSVKFCVNDKKNPTYKSD